mmetsp:Transcript_87561/g.203658  ORF Transcript_87561/g.203658 Transcript_87561/m.203658 type:complete len:350 (+) Transcript_87561:105-1154(+)
MAATKYDVLGVPQDADQREIRSAYRKLAMIHHPDKGGDKEEFQRIQSAYETLGDEDSRKQYDYQLRNPQSAEFPSGFRDFAGFGGFNFGGNFADFFGADLFGGGGGGFADLFGGEEGFGDDSQFEEFLNAHIFGGKGGFSGRASRGAPHPSWFFDFDMDDDEYFERQQEERRQRREKMERFVEEQREKRRIAKEQWQAEKAKRQQERPMNNHRKTLRKNVLKLVDKEAKDLNREELEDKLGLISNDDMEALWVVLTSRGSRSVSECMAHAMGEFGFPIAVPKAKKKKNKPAGSKKSEADVAQPGPDEGKAATVKGGPEKPKGKAAAAKDTQPQVRKEETVSGQREELRG